MNGGTNSSSVTTTESSQTTGTTISGANEYSGSTSGGQHDNVQPYIALAYIIKT